MIKVHGEQFELGKLSAIDQLTLLRKLGSATPLIEKIIADENKGKDRGLLTMFALSQISDSDMKDLMDVAFKGVQIYRYGTWSPLMSKGGLMFDDLQLVVLIGLITAIIEENLGPFFTISLAALQ